MIDLIDARRHLRIDGSDDDTQIQQKLAEAVALAFTYTGNTAAVPYVVQDLTTMTNEEITAANAAEKALWQNRGIDAAVLLILGDLWANREASTGNPLSPAVKNLLNLFREPGYA